MWETTAQGFAAMGSEARLLVLKTLVRAGEAGLTVGEIQERTGIAPSTLAHHLKFLAAGKGGKRWLSFHRVRQARCRAVCNF